jgi:hypothetical protein
VRGWETVMNCSDYRDLLQAGLDGRESMDPDAAAHLRDCADCAALLAASRRLEDGLRLLAPPTPPADLAGRIAGAVRADRRRWIRLRILRLSIAGLAALVLLALGLRLVLLVGPGRSVADRQQERRVPNQPPPPSPPDAVEGPDTLRESVENAGEAVASLTSRTAGATVGQTRGLLPEVSSPPLVEVPWPPSEAPTEGSIHPLREAGACVSEGLEPVTESARRAVDLFLRDLTPMGPQEKPGL